MDGVINTESKISQLTGLLGTTPWSGGVMGLSQANITPTPATVASDLTGSEVSVGGYSRQTLTSWSTPTIDGSQRAVSTATPVTFLNTGLTDSGTIYCWFFIDSSSGDLLASGRFSLPFVLVATTGSYTTTPFVRLTGA